MHRIFLSSVLVLAMTVSVAAGQQSTSLKPSPPAPPASTGPLRVGAAVDPTTATFTPSADHNKTLPDGTPVVTDYLLEVWEQGAPVTTWFVPLGKPAPQADGLIHAPLLAAIQAQIDQTKLYRTPDLMVCCKVYVAQVAAFGPGGNSAFTPFSNTFSFSATAPPPPPGPTPSPDNAKLPPALQIVDSGLHVWTLNMAGHPDVMCDATNTGGWATVIKWYQGVVYVLGVDGLTWYRWNGTGCAGTWASIGPVEPGGTNIPAVDCQYTTSCTSWSGCTPLTTTTGQQTRTCTITITQQASGSGKACPTVLTTTETQACTPPPPTPAPLTLTCPASVTATSSGGAIPVTYALPTATGGVTPYVIDETPVSGSSFPVGTTIVTGGVSDAAGKTAACSFTVTVKAFIPPPTDAELPVVSSLTVTRSGSSSNYTIVAKATDNVKVTKVQFLVDGTTVKTLTAPTTAPSTYTVSTSLYKTGPRVITVKAYDAAGNIGTASKTVIR